jgi:elongation factor P--beta-lysine ligase
MDAMYKMINKIYRNRESTRIHQKHEMDLYVIRYDSDGLLKNSKPCYHCILEMSKNKLIDVNTVYYSNELGQIISVKFKNLLSSKNHHISSGWKNHN